MRILTEKEAERFCLDAALQLENGSDRWCGISEAKKILHRGTGEKGLFWNVVIQGRIPFKHEIIKDEFGNVIHERNMFRESDLTNYWNKDLVTLTGGRYGEKIPLLADLPAVRTFNKVGEKKIRSRTEA